MCCVGSLPDTAIFLAQQQQYSYTRELCITHEAITRHHRWLSEIETKLAQRVEYRLDRKEKKRLQWSRAQIKSAIRNLEMRRCWLLECVQLCHVLERWYCIPGDAARSSAIHWPLETHNNHGFTNTPATSPQEWMTSNPEHLAQTQWWNPWNVVDTSKRRVSLPSAPSADSGYGSSVCGSYDECDPLRTIDNCGSHAPRCSDAVSGKATDPATPNSTCDQSEQTIAPNVSKSPRYAENAI